MKAKIILLIVFSLFLFTSTSFADVYSYVNGTGRTVYTQDRGYSTPAYKPTNQANVGNFKFLKSKEITADDIPLEFDHEKTAYEHGYLKIWGSIRNKNKDQTYDFIRVTFSLFGGRGGDLITREYTYANPKQIGPNQVGYIHEFMIKCAVSQINVIEYKVTGK